MAVPMGDGPPSARVMIVGEAWGEDEERAGKPFVGRSGQELDRMLHDAGILRSECYVTNVVNARPPRNEIGQWVPVRKNAITADMIRCWDRFVKPIVAEGEASLRREIELVRPSLLIALGNTALWALTGENGITKWRGSLLHTRVGYDSGAVRVVPTYHPAAILRQYEWRAIAVHDLKRARRELAGRTLQPDWNFRLDLPFPAVVNEIENLLAIAEASSLWLDFDIETAAGHIRCVGLSWSRTDALCIPLMSESDWNGYWAPEEETAIVWRLYRLLTHPNVKVRGQNLLYDFQYVYRHWHFIPNLGQDTMLSHHVLWAGLPKSLAFQASMYCRFYCYWKHLGKGNQLEKAGE